VVGKNRWRCQNPVKVGHALCKFNLCAGQLQCASGRVPDSTENKSSVSGLSEAQISREPMKSNRKHRGRALWGSGDRRPDISTGHGLFMYRAQPTETETENRKVSTNW